MERVLATSTVQQAKADTAECAQKTDPEDVEHQLAPLAWSVVHLPIYTTKSEIERILADLGVVTEADVQLIVKNRLDHLTRLIKWDLVKTVKLTYEDALQASYFDSRNNPKTTMLNVV